MSEESIRVIVRVRPKQIAAGETDDSSDGRTNITIDSKQNSITLPRGDKKGISEFKFSSVLGVNSTQDEVYKRCSDIISDLMKGINCCIMAYGQVISIEI